MGVFVGLRAARLGGARSRLVRRRGMLGWLFVRRGVKLLGMAELDDLL